MGARIGYLGPDGTFTSIAARALSVAGDDLLPLSDTGAVERALMGGQIDAGVLPISSSRAGEVSETREMLDRHALDLRVAGEHGVRVTFRLFRRADDAGPLVRVLSHPKALAQCAGFIADSGATSEATTSTAAACDRVGTSGESGLGAIAAPGAGAAWGLAESPAAIEDEPGAVTTFVRIERA